MDFDKDGDFDAADVTIAETAFGSAERERLGGEKLIWRYYHRDQLTSTTHVTDSLGDLVNQEIYDAYGKKTRRKGLAPVRGFGGSELEVEQELGLVRFGSRYYAPDLGRWITGDRSIGESPSRMLAKVLESNLYSYALNNPRMIFDPTGRDGEKEKADAESTEAMDKAMAFLKQQISEGKINLKGDLTYRAKISDTAEIQVAGSAELSVSGGKVTGSLSGSISVSIKYPPDVTGAYTRVEVKGEGKVGFDSNGDWKVDLSGGVKLGKRYEPPKKMQGELWNTSETGEATPLTYEANAYAEAGVYGKGTFKWSSSKGRSFKLEVGLYASEGYSLGFGDWSVKQSSEKSVPLVSEEWKVEAKKKAPSGEGQGPSDGGEPYGPPAPIMSIDPDLEACACSSG